MFKYVLSLKFELQMYKNIKIDSKLVFNLVNTKTNEKICIIFSNRSYKIMKF